MEILFVHGALVRDGEWWFARTAAIVEQRLGVRSRAVLLPSCGETATSGGLVDDAAALRLALDASGPAIVVAHSYGGTVVAEAGEHEAVRHLVFVSSYLPPVGASQADIMSGEPSSVSLRDAGGGLLELDGYDERSFAARFLHDADVAAQREAFARVTPQNAAAFVTPTTESGWASAESTYLVCADDRSTSVELQREHASRATRSVELPTGHHPFISHPGLVADELERALRAA